MTKAKTYTFYLDAMTGTLKKGKSRRAFQDALDRLLARFCGPEWEYKYPDEGLWGQWGEEEVD